jgi:hypothetical protein
MVALKNRVYNDKGLRSKRFRETGALTSPGPDFRTTTRETALCVAERFPRSTALPEGYFRKVYLRIESAAGKSARRAIPAQLMGIGRHGTNVAAADEPALFPAA